jgi:hypothetical protein
MSYKGGSILFRSSVNIEQQIIQILALTIGIEVVTEQPDNNAVIFKLTFAEDIGTYLLGLPLNAPRDVPTYVPPRTLIIKYAYNRIDDEDFHIESQVHLDIASADKKENLFPISPNYIFSQIIQQSYQPFTAIGGAFSQLLTIHNLKDRLDTYINGLLPMDRTHYKQTIIIMEMIDGITLYQGFSQLPNFSIVDALFPFTLNKTFLQNFYTFYLLTLLAEKGYSHGDPHSGNIMLVSTTGNPFFLNAFGDLLTQNGLNVVPYLIDFGRSAPLSELRFEPFTYEQLSDIDFQRDAAFYIETYNNMVPLLGTYTIESIVLDLIRNQHLYVQAILILTMCGDKHKSMFQIAQELDYSLYDSFFYITRENADALNILIREALNDRATLEQEHIRHIEQYTTTAIGRKYRYKKNKTKNHNKLHKKKINRPKKIKTRKNKK